MRILAEVPLAFEAGGRKLPVPLVEVEADGTEHYSSLIQGHRTM